MQRIIDLCKKPGNKARRNLASFQLCYRLKAQPRCVENFATVLLFSRLLSKTGPSCTQTGADFLIHMATRGKSRSHVVCGSKSQTETRDTQPSAHKPNQSRFTQGLCPLVLNFTELNFPVSINF